MVQIIVIADFVFVASSSFVENGYKQITVPARYHQELKKYGLITESTDATISFRDISMFKGSIRVGWRAGGKYYQIAIPKSQENMGTNDIKSGTRLLVRILKSQQDWLIEIK
jgi:hypothetical protein